MSYPIKTLSQLQLILKGFRKEKGLTQAAMGEKLGITQQSYASFETNPAAATLERLFKVLRLLDVEISLDQVSPAFSRGIALSANQVGKPSGTLKAASQKRSKSAGAVKVSRVVAPARKKESW